MRLLQLLGIALLLGCTEPAPPIVIRPTRAASRPDFEVRKEVRRIGFGGCAGDACSLTLLDTLAAYRPELFIWLGDNVYVNHPDSLPAAYQRLNADSSFQKLRSQTRMLATWDEFDYGGTPVDKDAFLAFWEDPVKSVRRNREGVYASYFFDGARRDVLVILLDTKSFRSTLDSLEGVALRYADGTSYFADHLPTLSPDSTVLGEEQWSWLESQLSLPCDIRVIASSMPFGAEFNGADTWANFPHEQHRMLRAIAATEAADRTVFVSGVAHYGEVSKLDSTAFEGYPASLPPLFDVTSSSLSSTPGRPTENRHRVGNPVATHNVGLLEWQGPSGMTARLLTTPPEAGGTWELHLP
jgi:alkaline phosphatase D